MKKTIVWLLIAAMLSSSVLTSCGESEVNTETDDAGAGVQDSAEAQDSETVPEETEYDPGVEKIDYQGYEFTIMDRATDSSGWWYSMDVYAEGLTGEPINDAVYERNEIVNDYFNIKIKPHTIPDGNFKNELKNSAAANDYLVDLAMLTLATGASCGEEGLLFDLHEFDVINFDAPYYTKYLTESSSILGRNYFLIGDMTLIANEGSWALMFNKQVAENYSVPDLYELARNGEWTVDKFLEITKDMGSDSNGDGEAGLEDFFGLLSTGGLYDSLIYSLDYQAVVKDENDALVYTGLTERLTKAAEYAVRILEDGRIASYGQYGGDWHDFQIMFEANQSLFYSEVLQCVTRLRNMEVDFGLLPQFKLDEQQEMYHTYINTWASDCLAIPTSVRDPEMSANVFEYLSFTSMDTLKPAYYDKALTYKAMRDEESVEMLDYHLEGRVFDYGHVADIGGVVSGLRNQLSSGRYELSSFFQKKMKVASKQLEKYMQNYLEME